MVLEKCCDKIYFFGGCATLVNLGSYYLLRLLTPLNLNLANVISVCIAILFAYFINSRFESTASGWNERFGEFVKFVSARILTMVVEVGGVWLRADILKMNDYLAKILIQFIVLVLNYIFSKFLVFTSRGGIVMRFWIVRKYLTDKRKAGGAR
jgi:putative flippase GtrA